MFEIKPTLSLELLLKYNSEERYMTHYLGVPITKKLFKSPLRVDHRETCGFYRNNKGKLIYNDFGEDHNFDFIAVVQYIHKCTYHKALQIIANDFGIIEIPKLEKNIAKIEYNGELVTKLEPCILQVEIKEYTNKELEWWKSFGISIETLKLYNVFSIKTVFINGIPRFFSDEKTPIYGYYFGKEEGRELWKIYFPTKTKYRFLLNNSKIQGVKQLPKTGNLLIITKSLKDVMTLKELGYDAIAPQSENSFIKEEQLVKLQNRFKYIIVWFDTDCPGLIAMKNLKKRYPNFIYHWIPRRYKVKDISDFRKKYGENKTTEYLDLLQKYFNEMLEHVTNNEEAKNS